MLFMVTTMTVMKKFAIYFLWREFVMTCIGKKGGQTEKLTGTSSQRERERSTITMLFGDNITFQNKNLSP